MGWWESIGDGSKEKGKEWGRVMQWSRGEELRRGEGKVVDRSRWEERVRRG